MKKIIYIFTTTLIISFVLIACTDDYFEFDKIKIDDWHPNLALPLINTTLTAEEILIRNDTAGVVKDDPNTGVMSLIYDGKVISPFGVAQVLLEDQNFDISMSSTSPLPITGGSHTIVDNRMLTFNSSVEIDSLLLKGGNMKLTLENTFEHSIEVEIKLDGFIDSNNQKLVINRSLAASDGSNTVTSTVNIDLNKYTINLSHGTQNHSKIPVETKITFNLTSGKSSTPTDYFKISTQLERLKFRNFVGYIGNQTPLSLGIDTIYVSLFKNIIEGQLFLSNPQLDIDIYNSYGIPTNLTFHTLKSRNPNNNPVEIPINLPHNQNTININEPTNFGIDSTKIRLNTSNSNIDYVVSSILKSIVYDSEIKLNPNGPTAMRNHISDTSKLSLKVLLRLPFEGRSKSLLIVDTLAFNFEGAEILEKGILRIATENGFPLSTEMQVYFVDANYNKLDSLFDTSDPAVNNRIIESSEVNGLGETISSTYKTMDIPVNKQRLKNLSQSKYSIIEARLLTKNHAADKNVRFLRSYKLSINLGIKAAILIN